MSHPDDELKHVGREVVPAWSDERASAVWDGLPARRRRRARARLAAATLVALLAVGGAFVVLELGRAGRGDGTTETATQPGPAPSEGAPDEAETGPDRRSEEATGPPVEESAAGEPSVLDEGARAELAGLGIRVEPLSEDAHLVVGRRETATVEVTLTRGAVRFEVEPDRPERAALRVAAGPVFVEVTGTVFEVRIESERVGVRVELGRVAVRGGSSERALEAADGWWWWPDEEHAAAEVRGQAEQVAVERQGQGTPGREGEREAGQPAADAEWEALAESGRFEEALERLDAAQVEPHDSVHELLLASDAARLGGQPERAVPWLERVLEGHADDARAPLAAFTLGRLWLEQLEEPRAAAAAFERARSLDSDGAMAEDALAREVEAWSRAGEAERARETAERYLERYPEGRRAAAVRELGGLD